MNKFMDNLKGFWSKTNRFHRGLLILLIIEIPLVPRGTTGFQCNDPALSHPYTGDTISWKWLLSVCALLPLLVMLIIERIYSDTDSETTKKRTLKWYKEYLFAYLVNLCLVQLLKLAVGSPRPHFFDTCKPKEAASCEGSEYVSSYTCTKAYWNWQSDKSFPSGHTSLAIHAGLFIAYYLHMRISEPNNLVRTVQVLSLCVALWCSISRMTDHRHHWWDVLAGAGIGVATFIYTTLHLCHNFECSAIRKSPEPVIEENVSINRIDT